MSALSIIDVARELVSWATPDPRSLLVAAFYIDDSGTHKGAPVVVFGGLIGEQEQWEFFEPRWKAELAAPLQGKKPPLKRFHMFDCKWGLGEFSGYSSGERDAATHDFRKIILDSGVHGVAAAISRADYDELMPDTLRATHGSADDMAFASAMSALDIDNRREDGVSLICDDTGEGSTARYASLYDRYQLMFKQQGGRTLEGLAFRSMEKVLPLQGADMIAWETYFYACAILKTPGASPRTHLQRYIDTGRFGAVHLFREHISQYVKRRTSSGKLS